MTADPLADLLREAIDRREAEFIPASLHGHLATAIRAALRDGTLSPEDLGMVRPPPPSSSVWQAFLEHVRQPSGMDTDARVAWGAERGWNRQCSIGWHSECSDRDGVNHRGECDCPCHHYDKGRIIDACLELEDERLSLWTLAKEAPHA